MDHTGFLKEYMCICKDMCVHTIGKKGGRELRGEEKGEFGGRKGKGEIM